tara:strand:+ start:2542 stop:3513 length:972 start_codon:yes stop_codon:yes gene_type:complete
MQTNSYGNLIKLIQSLIGAETLTDDEYTKISHFINRRLAEAYNTSPSWTRYVVSSEKRDINQYTLSGASASTSTAVNNNYFLLGQADDGGNTTPNTNIYESVATKLISTKIIAYKNSSNAWVVATGTSVPQQSDGRYRVSSAGTAQFTEADTIKKDKLEDVEVFTPRAGSDVLNVEQKNLIPYAQTNENTISEFIRIHRKKAFLNNSAIEYDFFVDGDGANILNVANSNDGQAFVTYKKQFTYFSVSASWASSSVEVPLEFFYFLAHASFADFLRLESKYSEARTEEAIAQGYLAQELEKIDIRNNNNSLNKKFSTYVNRQSR